MSKDAKMNRWLQKTMAKAEKNGVVKDRGASNVNRKEPRDILPKTIRFNGKVRMRNRHNAYEIFIKICPIVAQWVRNKRTYGAKKGMAYPLLMFCREANIMPKDFGELNKTREEILKARDMVWDVCSKLIDADRENAALAVRKSCKAFYRFFCKGDAELPFATRKGDYHYITLESKELPEFEWGTLEEAKEHFFDILSKAKDLTMRTVLLLVYVAGWRLNVFTHLKWKHLEEVGVINVDEQEVLVIKITPKIDTKQGRALKKYYSFITGDALKSLRLYEEHYRVGKNPEEYVFRHPEDNHRSTLARIQYNFKQIIVACENEGLLKNGASKPKFLTIHKIRKVFRKVMQEAKGLEYEYKEFLMGHKLKGSSENYALKDYRELARAYLKAEFSAPKDYYKAKYLEKLRKEEEEKTRTEVFKDEFAEGVIPETPEPTETPKEQAIVEKALSSRIPKPAPNKCLRDLTFHDKKTDSYCHTLCAKTHPSQYQACQELQVEQPEMFASKKNSAQH